MDLIATQTFTYDSGRRALKPGDRFRALSGEDARILKGLGKAVDDPRPGALQTASLSADEASPISPRRSARYRRTDMRAED